MEDSVLAIGGCSGATTDKVATLGVPLCLPGWDDDDGRQVPAVASCVAHVVAHVQYVRRQRAVAVARTVRRAASGYGASCVTCACTCVWVAGDTQVPGRQRARPHPLLVHDRPRLRPRGVLARRQAVRPRPASGAAWYNTTLHGKCHLQRRCSRCSVASPTRRSARRGGRSRHTSGASAVRFWAWPRRGWRRSRRGCQLRGEGRRAPLRLRATPVPHVLWQQAVRAGDE